MEDSQRGGFPFAVIFEAPAELISIVLSLVIHMQSVEKCFVSCSSTTSADKLREHKTYQNIL